MQIHNRVVVVTGAGSGIGKAMVAQFVEAGAREVVAVDIDSARAKRTADESGCVAASADVSIDEDIQKLVENIENEIGPIDLFCSNAGVATGNSERSPDSEWLNSWSVNVMSHVYAARHLVPRMIARGGGYLLNTASAAGLLNQVGGAAYGVTKHAAIGFAEWLALTYQHQGIKVSVLCPQAVRTPMTDSASEGGGSGAAGAKSAGQDGIMEPVEVASHVIDGLASEKFLILPHPDVATYMQRKTADYDRWLKGMNRLHLAMSDESC